jgi:DUF4097 and DUF4098 domain-containing protein YvlB
MSSKTCLTIAVLLLSSLAVAQDVSEEFHQSYAISPTGAFGLSNVNGDVKIVGWDRSEVRVDAVKTADTRERLDELKIEVEATSDRVYVRTKYPENSGSRGRGSHAAVTYTISMPRSARIDKVSLVNGALTVDNVAGDINASTVNGEITASGPGGTVDLSSVNGRIQTTLSRLDPARTVALKTVNGEVRLVLPGNPSANIKASSLNGDITNDFGLTMVRGEHVGRTLEGQIGAGGAAIQLKTVNGKIAVTRTGQV